MEFIHIVALALIQGLTEFLPISSSGHLILPKEVLGWPDQGLAFDVAVHIGTLTAVMTYFRKDIIAILTDWSKSLVGGGHTDNSALAWYIALGTIPAGIAGLIFNDFIEENFRSTLVIALTTIIFGLLLGWSDRHANQNQRQLADLTWKIVLIIGCFQALALIPGTSRSGITITAALLLGFSRDASARFSFLLSIPIILLSGGFKTLELISTAAVVWSDLIWGVVLSAISAFICIHYFLKFISQMGMMPFVIYRMLLGFGLLILFFLG